MGGPGVQLLRYRPWHGRLRPAAASVWPVARTALGMMFRRKMFWALYALSLTIFLMFFFGQYLLAWAEGQAAETQITVGFIRTDPSRLIHLLRDALKLNGRAETYRNLFWFQGSMVVILLALAGSVIVGNDFQLSSLPFYLSKPLGRRHYLTGKALAVAVFVNLMTTLPAIVLFVQYGLLDSWDYFIRGGPVLGELTWGGTPLTVRGPNPLLIGIIAYGLVLTACLSLMLLATATWLRRTVPLIMAWTSLFFFLRMLSAALVDGLQYDPRWRLLDLWNDLHLVGSACLGMGRESFRSPRQPEVAEAAIVLAGVCLLCLTYLTRRIRAVEIVR